MNRIKHLPLTETVFYILLSLLEPSHGYLILQKIEDLSNGTLRMAAGTLYGAIENLVKLGFIEPVDSGEKRRKVYVITHLGLEVLKADQQRMSHMVLLAEQALKHEE